MISTSGSLPETEPEKDAVPSRGRGTTTRPRDATHSPQEQGSPTLGCFPLHLQTVPYPRHLQCRHPKATGPIPQIPPWYHSKHFCRVPTT